MRALGLPSPRVEVALGSGGGPAGVAPADVRVRSRAVRRGAARLSAGARQRRGLARGARAGRAAARGRLRDRQGDAPLPRARLLRRLRRARRPARGARSPESRRLSGDDRGRAVRGVGRRGRELRPRLRRDGVALDRPRRSATSRRTGSCDPAATSRSGARSMHSRTASTRSSPRSRTCTTRSRRATRTSGRRRVRKTSQSLSGKRSRPRCSSRDRPRPARRSRRLRLPFLCLATATKRA